MAKGHLAQQSHARKEMLTPPSPPPPPAPPAGTLRAPRVSSCSSLGPAMSTMSLVLDSRRGHGLQPAGPVLEARASLQQHPGPKSICEPPAKLSPAPRPGSHVWGCLVTSCLFTFTQHSRCPSSNPPTSTKHQPPNNLKSKVPRYALDRELQVNALLFHSDQENVTRTFPLLK